MKTKKLTFRNLAINIDFIQGLAFGVGFSTPYIYIMLGLFAIEIDYSKTKKRKF
jgi:hypothetical protein